MEFDPSAYFAGIQNGALSQQGSTQTGLQTLTGGSTVAPSWINNTVPHSDAQQTTPTNNNYNAYVAAQQKAAQEKQAQVNYVNKLFDVKKAGLQSQLDTLPAQQHAGELQIKNQYTNKSNALATDKAKGERNLTESQYQVEAGRERGLKSLRDQLQQKAMSYGNQLGAYGAGDSSAAQLINQALAGQSAENRGNLLTNTSQQLTTIDTQRRDLSDAFDQNMKTLEDWKTQTLSEMYTKYAQQKTAIINEMANADAQRQQQLAQYDAALTQSAIDSLTNVKNLYKQQGSELISRYQNMFAPQDIQIDPSLQQYEVKPIDAGKLAGMAMPLSANPDSQLVTATKRRDDEQLANGPLSY